MTTPGVILAALLLALGRPAWWLVGIAGFLARGGIVLFLLAIVTLPSPLALSNLLGPFIVPLAFGTLLPQTALLFSVATLVGVVWLVLGSWFGAASEVGLIRDTVAAAEDDSIGGALARTDGSSTVGPDGRHVVGRVAVARLLAHVPTALAVAIGGALIIAITYRELITPSDDAPLAIRVVGGGLTPIASVVTLWLVGEIVGGHAARRIVLDGDPVGRGVLGAVMVLVRHPIRSFLMPVLLTAILALDLAGLLAVVVVVLGDTRDRLTDALADPVALVLVVSTLGAAWCLALLVTGLIASWRAAAMTLEHVRLRGDRSATTARVGEGTSGRRDNRGTEAPPSGG